VLFGKEAQMIQPSLHWGGGVPTPVRHADMQYALQVNRPVVVALTAARALRLREVTVVNESDLDCAKSMECARARAPTARGRGSPPSP
jgi:hypothetical protein